MPGALSETLDLAAAQNSEPKKTARRSSVSASVVIRSETNRSPLRLSDGCAAAGRPTPHAPPHGRKSSCHHLSRRIPPRIHRHARRARLPVALCHCVLLCCRPCLPEPALEACWVSLLVGLGGRAPLEVPPRGKHPRPQRQHPPCWRAAGRRTGELLPHRRRCRCHLLHRRCRRCRPARQPRRCDLYHAPKHRCRCPSSPTRAVTKWRQECL